MKKIGIKRLSKAAFDKYGSYASVMEPEGEFFGGGEVVFYRDMIQQSLGNTSNVSYSACVVEQRPHVIQNAETHDTCHETIICLDGDYLMHVAPAVSEKKIPYDKIEVFLIPKGTVVNVKAGVWHQAGFPYGCDKVHILCALPERTYMTDCYYEEIPKSEQIQIVDEFTD